MCKGWLGIDRLLEQGIATFIYVPNPKESYEESCQKADITTVRFSLVFSK